MAAGKRLPEESYENYRNRLWWEEQMLKKRKKGVVVWCSAIVINTGSRLFPVFKKMRVRGTYRKGMKIGNAYQQL